jgi:MYXO-CTERM domain-containing protein
VANIKFVEVADDGAEFNADVTASGDIRIGGHTFDGVGGTLSHGYFPPANGASAAGDVHFDVAETWKIGFGGPGRDIARSFAHEVGHALGLNHAPLTSALMHASYSESFFGPQPDDIAGVQFLYGPPLEIVVPEPSTWALAMLALALAPRLRRRNGRL